MFKFIKTTRQCLKLANVSFEDSNNLVNGFLKAFSKVMPVNTVHLKSLCTNSISPATEDKNHEPNFAEITQSNPELEHKLKVLLLELDVSRQEGRLVPENASMKTVHWQQLLKLPSVSARRKYLLYLFKTEKTKENRLRKQIERRLEREANPRPPKEDNELNYDLGHNHMFLRFYDNTMNNMYNNRLVQAMQFGQKLIVDCGYNDSMTDRENNNCAKQLMLLFAENRFAVDPFDLHLCNVNHESTLIKGLHRNIPTMYDPWFPLNLHEKSYLDLFPKEKLVYLTPHCRDVVHQYDHDSIYIIGAIVDKVNNEPLSMAKAKQEGIKMAKFPLDHHLEWGSGSGKSLTLNQVLSILVDIKFTGDWKYALRHVPRRKLVDFSEEAALRKFTKAIGYTAGVNNRKYAMERTWRPGKRNNLDNLEYKSNVKSSINVKKILQD